MSVQFQSDRLALSWSRTVPSGEPADYPGFDEMKSKLADMLGRLADWCRSINKTAPDVRMAELSYHNALPLEQDGKKRRLSEVFKFVSPQGRPVNAFQAAWTEALRRDPLSPRVTMQTGLGGISPGGAMPPTLLPHLLFMFVGLGPLPDPEYQNLSSMLDALHSRIHEMYAASIELAAI